MEGIASRALATFGASLLLAVAGCGGEDSPSVSELKEPGSGSAADPADDLADGRRGPGTETGAGVRGADSPGSDAGGGSEGGSKGKSGKGSGGGAAADPPTRRQGRALAKRDPATGPPDDVADAHAFMSDYLGRLRKGDASVCTDLFTQGHVERVTGKKGAAAVEQCRKDIGGRRVDVKLRDLESVNRLAPDRIELTARIESAGRVQTSKLELLGAAGSYRIDRGG